MKITYVGKFRGGVEVFDDRRVVEMPYGEPVELSDELAGRLLAEQPHNFEPAEAGDDQSGEGSDAEPPADPPADTTEGDSE